MSGEKPDIVGGSGRGRYLRPEPLQIYNISSNKTSKWI
nr:MAG TPA: hypothetical protein [Caudoviricetes sp.]